MSRHLAAFSARGEVTSRRVTIEVGGVTATVPLADVADGSVWTNRFPDAVGVAGRDVREALRDIVDDQAARLPLTPMHSRWDAGGALVLPPADVLPRGYLTTAGTWADFRAIVRAMVDAPRIALVAGLAVGGLYVAPLGHQSYVVHLPGRGRSGKTTGARMAAAVFGFPGPEGLVLPWNVTENGLAAWLRGLSCLTGFRDELGASGFTTERLSSMVFRAVQGAERDVSGRTGEHRESLGSWHGALISTGNESIVERITNEGIGSRVVEVAGPLTTDAHQAEGFARLIRRGYGHGLAALADRKLHPEEFGQWADTAGGALPLPGGGPERTLGHSIALGLAGARLLAELVDVPGLVDAATSAGREVLAELISGLAERGANPGDRLMAAVSAALASNPAAFPTRDAYVRAVSIGERVPHDVWGWDLSGEQGAPGDVAVIQARLSKITEPAGIADAAVALRELSKRPERGLPGLVVAANGRDRARLVRVGGRPIRAYVFAGVHTDSNDHEEAAVPQDDLHSTPVTTFEDQVTTPVTTSKPAADQGRNDSNDFSSVGVCREGETDGNSPCGKCREPGKWCGFGGAGAEPAPCVCCGSPTSVRSLCGAARTAICHGKRPESPVKPTDTPPATTDTPVPAPAALGAAGAVSGANAEELGHWGKAVREWAERAGVEVDEALVPVALDVWHRVTDGLRFVSYPGEVGVAAYARLVERHRSMPEPTQVESPLVAEISTGGRMVRHLDHVDAAVAPELGQAVTVHDVRGQFLAAAQTVELGDGEPAHYVRPRSIAPLTRLPGYVLLGSPIETDIPAYSAVSAGEWLPMPHVAYLDSRGVGLDVAETVVWHQHGRRLGAWAGLFSRAWKVLTFAADVPSAYALGVLKSVYAAFLGGMLRSDRYNHTGTMRPDWSDQLIALGWVNMLRNADRADYGLPCEATEPAVVEAIRSGRSRVVSPMGMCRDSVWYLADSGPVTPEGLRVERKLGRFKVEKWCEMTPEIVDAHSNGSAYLVREEINSAIKAGRGERL